MEDKKALEDVNSQNAEYLNEQDIFQNVVDVIKRCVLI